MSRISSILAITVLVFMYPNTAVGTAATVPGLYDTGVDNTGTPVPIGTVDTHYLMTGPLTPARVIQRHKNWVVPSATAAWIGPADGNQDHPVGQYIYTLTFDLSGFVPSTAHVWGTWSADNHAKIQLNGFDTGIAIGDRDYVALHAFDIVTGFVEGVNTLEFVVNNIPGVFSNPTGLVVVGIMGTADAPVAVEEQSWGALKVLYMFGNRVP